MMRTEIVIVVSLFVIFVIVPTECSITDIDLKKSLALCNKTATDQVVRWLFFFNDPDRQLPDNPQAFEEFCNERNEKEIYVNDYAKKCLAKFPKQITQLLMYGIIRKNRYFCGKDKKINELIHGAKCLNTVKDKGAKCLSRAIHDFLAVPKAPLKGRVGRTCCIYYQLEECLVAQTHNSRVCTSRDSHLMEDILDGYTRQVLTNICTNYQKAYDRCSKLLPKREMAKWRKSVEDKMKTTFSILPPLIEILDSIPP